MSEMTAQILLVEDNDTNRDVATRMLHKIGAEVDLAVDGFDAIEKMKTHPYKLVFMDWEMPGMDGVETASLIRELPNGKETVIVILSGHSLIEDREELQSVGFNDYLSKPVRMDDFRAILKKWLPPQADSTL